MKHHAETQPVGSLDEATIVNAVIKVAAYVFERSEEDVRQDVRPYEATCGSEVYNDCYFPEIDWRILSLPAELVANTDGGTRCDFDLTRSIVHAPGLLEQGDIDDGIKQALTSQQHVLYGEQIQALVLQGRLKPNWHLNDELGLVDFDGCIQAKTPLLVDVLRAMLFLNDPSRILATPGPYAEVDDIHQALLESLGPKVLQDHIGLFFQTPSAARSSGVFLNTHDMREAMMRHLAESMGEPFEPLPRRENSASWHDGEGLGSYSLSLRELDAIPSVPAAHG